MSEPYDYKPVDRAARLATLDAALKTAGEAARQPAAAWSDSDLEMVVEKLADHFDPDVVERVQALVAYGLRMEEADRKLEETVRALGFNPNQPGGYQVNLERLLVLAREDARNQLVRNRQGHASYVGEPARLDALTQQNLRRAGVSENSVVRAQSHPLFDDRMDVHDARVPIDQRIAEAAGRRVAEAQEAEILAHLQENGLRHNEGEAQYRANRLATLPRSAWLDIPPVLDRHAVTLSPPAPPEGEMRPWHGQAGPSPDEIARENGPTLSNFGDPPATLGDPRPGEPMTELQRERILREKLVEREALQRARGLPVEEEPEADILLPPPSNLWAVINEQLEPTDDQP